MTVSIGTAPLTRDELVAVVRGGDTVVIAEEALAVLRRQRASIEEMVQSGTPVYGVSTGFGSLATTFVAPDQRRDLQLALVRSHAAGLGTPVETEVVRAMIVSRLTTLCSSVSGVRETTAQALSLIHI